MFEISPIAAAVAPVVAVVAATVAPVVEVIEVEVVVLIFVVVAVELIAAEPKAIAVAVVCVFSESRPQYTMKPIDWLENMKL